MTGLGLRRRRRLRGRRTGTTGTAVVTVVRDEATLIVHLPDGSTISPRPSPWAWTRAIVLALLAR